MDGCKIIAISGIDGKYSDFTNYIEPNLNCKKCLKISYDRSLTFVQNIEIMRTIIEKEEETCCLVGWSIGAVACAFLADCTNVKIIIMINPFYKRSDILKRRNIFCDEEVCILSVIKQPIQYVIISGIKDDKIPYTESIEISKYFNISMNNVYLIESAEHGLDSFPLGRVSDIINSYLL